jgi:hypothetical protein
VLSE